MNKRGARGAKGAKPTRRPPRISLRIAITLAGGVASGGEAWAGQRLPIFISGPRLPPAEKAAGLKPSLAKTVGDGLKLVG